MARNRFAPLTSMSDGFVFPSDLGSARRNIEAVAEMIGGTERLADWADKNPGEFFTKVYPKIIERHVKQEVALTESLEQKLARLESEASAGDRAINITAYSVDGVPHARETVSNYDDGDDE